MSKSYEHLLSEIPESADYCREFQNDVRTMFVIDSVYLEKMRYVAINQLDNQPYILHTKVIGMYGSTICSVPVETFAESPKRISYDEFLQLAERVHPGLEKLYTGINSENWLQYTDAFSKYRTGK